MAGPTGYLAPYLVLPATNLSLHPTHSHYAPNIPAISFPPRLGDRNLPGLGQCYQHGQGLRRATGGGPGVLGDTGSGAVKIHEWLKLPSSETPSEETWGKISRVNLLVFQHGHENMKQHIEMDVTINSCFLGV